MEAKELRIGNLVEYSGNIETVYNIKNSGIDFFRGTTKKSVITQGYIWKAINPIPLTEEWLLKFGFENNQISANHNVIKYLGYDNISIYGMLGIVKPVQCIYVHQLQNLYFALTGEELTIIENGK